MESTIALGSKQIVFILIRVAFFFATWFVTRHLVLVSLNPDQFQPLSSGDMAIFAGCWLLIGGYLSWNFRRWLASMVVLVTFLSGSLWVNTAPGTRLNSVFLAIMAIGFVASVSFISTFLIQDGRKNREAREMNQ